MDIFGYALTGQCSIHNFFFFNFYLVAPWLTLDHYRGDSLTHPMLITAFYLVWPEGHREPRDEVGFLGPAQRQRGLNR